jgi:hypothetical protein
VDSTLYHKRPATASYGRVSAPTALVRADRPSTASGYLSPSKLLREAAAAALGTDEQQHLANYVPNSSSSQRPQSASAALVGLQAQLIAYFEETPAAVRRSSAGGQRRKEGAGAAPPRSKSSEKQSEHSSTAKDLANVGKGGAVHNAQTVARSPDNLVAHKRPVSAPLNLFHDAPRQAVVQLNTEARSHVRGIQTRAAEVDRKQRAARKRSQKLQDAADLGKLRLQHLMTAETELGRQRPQSAPSEAPHGYDGRIKAAGQDDSMPSKLLPSQLEPIAEVDRPSLPVQLKRPKSAAGVLMTLGGGNKPGALASGNNDDNVADHADDDASGDDDGVDEDERGEMDETDEGELACEMEVINSTRDGLQFRERCRQFFRERGLCGGMFAGLRRVGFVALCAINPFALSAALCVYRKHEGPSPLVLAVVYNVWVILSDVPMACILLDYSLRRGMLTVSSVLDGGGASISSRIVAADKDGTPWVAMELQWPGADVPVDLAVYAAMAWTAVHLCLHLSLRWVSCARCCCAGVSCKRSLLKLCQCCKPKPRPVSSTGEELQARAQLYVTAGTHQHHSETTDDDDSEEKLALHRNTGAHRSRPRSARPGSGGTHHEVDVLLERPRSATVVRTSQAATAPAPAPAIASKRRRKASDRDKRADTAGSSVPHEVAEFEIVRPRPRSAVPLPALHSLRESSHGEDAGHVNQSLW